MTIDRKREAHSNSYKCFEKECQKDECRGLQKKEGSFKSWYDGCGFGPNAKITHDGVVVLDPSLLSKIYPYKNSDFEYPGGRVDQYVNDFPSVGFDELVYKISEYKDIDVRDMLTKNHLPGRETVRYFMDPIFIKETYGIGE